MEIELVRQNYSRPNSIQYSPSNPILPRFRMNRSRRLLSHTESDISEAMSTSFNNEHIPCHYCHNLVFASAYDQHVNYCPVKIELQRENRLDRREIPVFHLEGGSESQHVPDFDETIVENETSNSNNLVSSNSEISSNNEQILESSVSLPMMPEAQDYHGLEYHSLEYRSIEPFSSVSSELPSILEEGSNTDNNQAPENIQEQNPQDPVQTVALPDNGNNRQAPGTLVIRTIESGDDGSRVVRMRAIPLDRIFGRQDPSAEGTQENPNAEPPNILRLLSILAGLQGMRAAHFADFLSFLQGERGLDREVLESLPVVNYTAEGFKNVDEESKRCTICLDNYEEEQEVKFLWCMHRFHKNCVDQWLNSHTNCPFCKKDYSEAIRNYE